MSALVLAVLAGCAPPVTREQAEMMGDCAIGSATAEFHDEPALEPYFAASLAAYRRGKRAFDRGDYAAALEAFRESLRAQKPVDDRYVEIRGCLKARASAVAYHVLPKELLRESHGVDRAEAVFAEAEGKRVAGEFAVATAAYNRALAAYGAACAGRSDIAAAVRHWPKLLDRGWADFDGMFLGFVPGGRQVLTLRGERVVAWDIYTGEVVRRSPGTLECDVSVWMPPAVSANGRWLAGYLGWTVVVHDLATGTVAGRVTNAVSMETCGPRIDVSEDGSRLAVPIERVPRSDEISRVLFVIDDGKVRPATDVERMEDEDAEPGERAAVVEVATGGTIWESAERGDVDSMVFSPDERLVAVASDRVIRLYDSANGTLQATLRPRDSYAGALAFSPDGRRLACVANAPSDDLAAGRRSGHVPHAVVSVWEVQSEKEVLRRVTSFPFPRSLAFSPDGRFVVVAAYEAFVLDASTGREMRVFAPGRESGAISAAEFSPDGQFLAARVGNLGMRSCRVWLLPEGLRSKGSLPKSSDDTGSASATGAEAP